MNSEIKTGNIAVCILAAGESKRMGQSKQLVKFEGTTLLRAILENVKNLSPHIFCVLGANGANVQNQNIDLQKICWVNNKDWHNGISSSIIAGLEAIEVQLRAVDGILFVLGDQPFLTEENYNLIISTFRKNNYKVVAAKYGINNLGIPALIHRSLFSQLKTLEEDVGAKYVINHEKNSFGIDFGQNTRDIDLPQDLIP